MGQAPPSVPQRARHKRKNNSACHTCDLWPVTFSERGARDAYEHSQHGPLDFYGKEGVPENEIEALLHPDDVRGAGQALSTMLKTQLNGRPNGQERWQAAKAEWERQVVAQLAREEPPSADEAIVTAAATPSRDEERRKALNLVKQELEAEELAKGDRQLESDGGWALGPLLEDLDAEARAIGVFGQEEGEKQESQEAQKEAESSERREKEENCEGEGRQRDEEVKLEGNVNQDGLGNKEGMNRPDVADVISGHV
mmetsp:Transcript_15339/g.42050  ORF Transcript_15339/g.42050 Transcript_15339/m.42050 type:complete len:255 (+) Transcript_15339:58-822(+)